MSIPARAFKGFTLVELMIVVAIVAILAVVAYPSYQNSMIKSRRADGQALLMSLMNAQERYYTLNNGYTTDLSQLGFTVSSGQVDSDEGFYKASAAFCTSGDSSCVTLTAVPQGGQSSDGNITLNSKGVKAPTSKW